MIRFLPDQGIPRSAVARLQDRGFAARHVADSGLERASDLDIRGPTGIQETKPLSL